MSKQTNERDELRKVIFDSHRLNTQIDLQDDRRLKGSQLAWAGYAADAILAAGYRKPRTVTTVKELDALPVGSVVLRNGRAFQRFAPHQVNAFYEYKMWQCTDGGFVRSTKDGSSILPATVLHEGDSNV